MVINQWTVSYQQLGICSGDGPLITSGPFHNPYYWIIFHHGWSLFMYQESWLLQIRTREARSKRLWRSYGSLGLAKRYCRPREKVKINCDGYRELVQLFACFSRSIVPQTRANAIIYIYCHHLSSSPNKKRICSTWLRYVCRSLPCGGPLR